MEKAEATFHPPVPMEPELDTVTLHLSAQEAQDLAVILGHTVPGGYYGVSVNKIHSALWDAGVESSTIDSRNRERYENLPDTIPLIKK